MEFLCHCLLLSRQGRAPVPADLGSFPACWLSAEKPLGKLPIDVFRGDHWCHTDTEMLPTWPVCAALSCLPLKKVSLTPAGTGMGRRCGCHEWLLVCPVAGGRIQPPEPHG